MDSVYAHKGNPQFNLDLPHIRALVEFLDLWAGYWEICNNTVRLGNGGAKPFKICQEAERLGKSAKYLEWKETAIMNLTYCLRYGWQSVGLNGWIMAKNLPESSSSNHIENFSAYVVLGREGLALNSFSWKIKTTLSGPSFQELGVLCQTGCECATFRSGEGHLKPHSREPKLRDWFTAWGPDLLPPSPLQGPNFFLHEPAQLTAERLALTSVFFFFFLGMCMDSSLMAERNRSGSWKYGQGSNIVSQRTIESS